MLIIWTIIILLSSQISACFPVCGPRTVQIEIINSKDGKNHPYLLSTKTTWADLRTKILQHQGEMRKAGQIVRYADQDYDIAIHSSASGQKFHDVLNSPEKIGTSIKEFYALIMTNQFTVRISPHPDAVAIYAYDN